MFAPVIAENSIELVHAYDPLLFITSLVIASFGGYVALWLINRAWETADSRRGLRWLAAASGAMGLGIWSMHRGHAAGDRVLRMLADRLEGTLRDGDTVARFGGDEFAVLLEGVSTPEDIEQAVSRVRGVFEAPFEVGETAFPLTVSIGVAHSGLDVDEPEELVRLADVAMYRAKRSERTDVHVFDPDRDRALTAHH